MVAKGPPMTAQSIMTSPGLDLAVFQRSPSWRFFAHTSRLHSPLNASFRPAARAARAKVTVKAGRGLSDPSHAPQGPCVSASVRKAVYRP